LPNNLYNWHDDVMSGRRTWNKDYYEQKAAWRAENEEEYGQEEATSEVGLRSDKEEFKGAVKGTAGPMGSNRAFLSARSAAITADKEVGKVKVVTAQQVELGDGAGFYCEVCKCLLKDDRAYLNHVNGKNHQRALGFSMRVERAAVSNVKDKLKGLKRLKAGQGGAEGEEMSPDGEVVESEGGKQSNGNDGEKMVEKGVQGEALVDGAPQKKPKRDVGNVEAGDDVEMLRVMGFGGFK
jgi:U4/U6.U5 tri-snRNP component SNU23